jgi:CDP-diacylglycerol--serine O-phosphatidyltransferase
MPSPAAAALIAGLVWVFLELGFTGPEVRWPACILTIFAGVTMVSNIPYYSGKDINLRRSVPFMVIAAIALAFALISFYPPGVLFALFLVYAASGYVLAVTRWNASRRGARKNIARTE